MNHLRPLTLLLLPILLVACSKKQPSIVPHIEGSPEQAAVINNPVSPNQQLSDSLHGKEVGFSIGALSGVNGSLANGVASAHYFEDKGVIFSVQLNIAEAKAGSHYEAWAQSSGDGQMSDLGKLENAIGDVRHSLRFDTQENLRNKKTIVITLQQDGRTQTPGPVVANGILKDTSR